MNNMVMAGTSVSQAGSTQPTNATTAGTDGTGYLGALSSPLQARASLLTSLNRTASRAETKSPFRQGLAAEGVGGGTGPGPGSGGSGMGRFGFR